MSKLKSVMTKIRKVIYVLFMIGGIFAFFMAFITLSDVVGRYFLSKPIHSALEMCQLSVVCLVFLSLAYTQAIKGHVDIDILFTRFPHRVQNWLDIISSFLSLALAGILIYAAMDFALDSMASSEYTGLIFRIPVYPFKFLMFVAMLALSVELLRDVLDSYHRIGMRGDGNVT